MNDEDEDEEDETAYNQRQEASDATGFTPGNAAQNFDRVSVNPNFQFPGAQNRLAPPQNQQLGHGKIRPQSAKTADDQHLKFQQQAYQNMQGNPGAWGQGIQEQSYSYQMSNNQVGGNPPALIGGFTAPYAQNGFYQGVPQGVNILGKKRPTTANRRNNVQFGVGKKAFGSKNPSTIDLEISRMRPRIIHQERERLYDDAMKQKIAANYLKDENIKLKTKIQFLETELTKKERLVDDLLMQQDSYQVGISNAQNMKGMSKIKLEGHLSMNLKRKIREMQASIIAKSEENEMLKRNIKSTKMTEIEVEMKMYLDECTRLRHQLEEVIKSKDTFADPEELKMIEEKFQQQEILINSLKNENNELAMAYGKKEDENRQLRDLFQEVEKKQKKALASGKEKSKLKKLIKEKEKDLSKMKSELQNQKAQNEDYRTKIEDLVKKSQNTTNFNSRPQTANQYQNLSSNQGNTSNVMVDQENKKLRQEVVEKDSKIKEQNNIVQQLQIKLQDKINELSKESSEKQKFKDLYEKYQGQLAQYEAQAELGHPIKKQQTQKAQEIAQPLKEDKKHQQAQQQKQDKSFEKEKKIARVDPSTLEDVFMELRLKLQQKSFYSNQMKDFFFKPYSSDSQVSVKVLKDIFECNGINEKKSQLIARYIVEPKNQAQVAYSEENSVTQKQVIEAITDKIGHYKIYNDANLVKKYNEKIQKLFASCKGTLKDTIQLEDYEEEGTIPYGAFREAFDTLDLEVDEEIIEYILYVVYQKSESIEKMKYQALFDLIEGKSLQGQLSVGSEGQTRKRPESSSPEKLKARNKEKFTGNSQQTEQDKKKKGSDDGDDEEEDNYEEEFEKLLDKDDEDEDDKADNVKHSTVKINEGHDEEEANDNQEQEDDEYIDEEEMLDIAERCFVRIAEGILQKGISVRQAFAGFIIKEELEGSVIELLTPIGFLEGIKELGIIDLEEVEVACLMRVLTKADLENAILLRELIVIMENFGIKDDDDDEENQYADDQEEQEAHSQFDSHPNVDDQQQQQQQNKKKKKKKASGKQMDLSLLDEKSIKIMAKLMLALMELNVSLYDFFEGVIYEQLVKTKTKQNKVEIIQSKDFFEMLQRRGVRKNDNIHENLQKFLQLDPNYPNLIMIKKIAKALDEMAKNEELMAGILGAAEEGDIAAAEGQIDDYDDENSQLQQQQQRLITIGEDGEEDRHYDTTNKGDSKGTHVGKKKLAAIQQEHEEEDGGYEQQDFEENEDEDYAF